MNLASSSLFGVVSPVREMGTYEWLWQQDDGPVKISKAVAQLFLDNPGALSSDLVDSDDAIACAHKVSARFEKRSVGQFSVRMNDIGNSQEKLCDTENPLEFLYYQGNWDLAYLPTARKG